MTITILQRRFPIRAPIAAANDVGTRIKRDGHDRTAGQRRARAGRNRRSRRKLQGNPGKIRARARRIFCDHAGERAPFIRTPAARPAVTLDVKRLSGAPFRKMLQQDVDGRDDARL